MTKSHDDDTYINSIKPRKEALVPPRINNVMTSKPYVPPKIGNMRDGANDYKEWPSKYFY